MQDLLPAQLQENLWVYRSRLTLISDVPPAGWRQAAVCPGDVASAAQIRPALLVRNGEQMAAFRLR